MDGNSVLAFVMIYTAVIQDVKAARLTITPSQNLQAGATSLTLRCSPVSNSVYDTLYSIQINKRTLLQNSQTTNMAVIDGRGTTPGTGITTPKYTVTGNYAITQQPTQGFLQIIINNPDCNDAAEYQCITNGEPTIATNPGTLQEDKNVTVQSNPGTVEMTRFQEKMNYSVGEKIEIKCKGDVGNPEKSWFWESKLTSDSFFNPIRENITKGTVDPPTSTRCGYYSRSTLNYYVGQDDNGLVIRCKADNSDLHSDNKTIYVTNAKAVRLTITPSQNLKAGATSLTLRCSPVSNSVYTNLYSIQINKRTLVQNSQTTLMAVINGAGTTPGTGITPPKYTVTGNYDINQQPTQGFLQIIIINPDFNDAAEYQCITTGAPTISTNPGTLQENKNVTVENAKAVRLTITPSQNLKAGATSLTLRCSPVSNSVYTNLYSIQINKRTLVQNSQTTLMAVINGAGTTPGTGITPPKYTVTGNYDINQQPTQGFLQIIIINPDFNDAAEYQCITTGAPTISTNPGTLQENKNVTVESTGAIVSGAVGYISVIMVTVMVGVVF
ncbi:uncharacterized protein LOC126830091 isoform X2 [Patella vulgata]|uniref:uncharacterized protein LOC126830091 isoform X2 n=1 Tax=Patella vulgata TaxID=6465 RepID=UPI0024A973FD|nr:uncharacterized protein LOC126830091 isoform X2 [Patella vulgata]